jgi:hypothetical protein
VSSYRLTFAKGILIGPSLQTALKKQIPGVQTFPVLYAASLGTNISNDRTDAASIAEGVKAFNKAAGCGVLIAGGYSQGAAVVGFSLLSIYDMIC